VVLDLLIQALVLCSFCGCAFLQVVNLTFFCLPLSFCLINLIIEKKESLFV